MRNVIRILLGVVLLTTGLQSLGCHGAAYEASLDRREKAIHDLYADFMSREVGRPVNIKELEALSKRLQDLYKERLDYTLKEIERRSKEDVTDWKSGASNRKQTADELFSGDEESTQFFVEHAVY